MVSLIIERAQQLRETIEAMAAGLDDATALDNRELFPIWEADGSYEPGDRVRFAGVLYSCLQKHNAQERWNPAEAVSLWARVLIPDPSVIPEWEQPDSTNPYHMGDKVRHNGATWVSDVDANVWEPGVYGWSEVAG
jgi:chitodextrinase